MAARNLLNIEQVHKSFGERPLLDGVSLGVGAGERIAVVGRNGAGKSTLLHVLAGAEAPDSGRVTVASDVHLALVSQSESIDADQSVGDYLLPGRAPHEWASVPRIREVLTGLLGGFDEAMLARRLGEMSGGERRRVQLARALIADLDLLLLDEPTNHLDVEVVDWLATHLGERSRLAVIVVTHDRWFLDAICDRTWEVVDGRVEEYDGGYSAFVLAKAERARQSAASEAHRQNLLRKELAWLRRGPPARTSKPKFRIDAANALISAEPPARDAGELLAFANARLGKSVFDLDDVTLALGDRVLLQHCTWSIGPGDRIGIVGANGAGKTSLVRLLLGQLEAASGSVTTGVTVKPAYLSQHLDELDPDLRLLQAVERVAQRVELGKGRELTASQLCERLGFGPDAQWTPVGDLSGGERRRLQLTRLLMGGPNVLILDEPTNDFDVETLAALEDLLDGFAGTLIVISHDRYFLERVCDEVYALLGDGTVRHMVGGLDEYLAIRRAAAAVSSTMQAPGKASSSAAEQRALAKEVARLERAMAKAAEEEKALHERMADQAADHEALHALNRELQAVIRRRDELEAAWLEAAEGLG